jgi:predicted PurR-regulated permease PerM
MDQVSETKEEIPNEEIKKLDIGSQLSNFTIKRVVTVLILAMLSYTLLTYSTYWASQNKYAMIFSEMLA